MVDPDTNAMDMNELNNPPPYWALFPLRVESTNLLVLKVKFANPPPCEFAVLSLIMQRVTLIMSSPIQDHSAAYTPPPDCALLPVIRTSVRSNPPVFSSSIPPPLAPLATPLRMVSPCISILAVVLR
jgi:hypothetical protein